jgi:hypothetical protein
MSAWLRFLGFAALLASCNFAVGGNWFGSHGCSGDYDAYPYGVYRTHDGVLPPMTLEIGETSYYRRNPTLLLIAHGLPHEACAGFVFLNGDGGFDFKGVSSTSGELVSHTFKWVGGETISDITDPANPITLSRQKEPTAPFPWTATFVVSALIVGGLIGRYSAKRSSISRTSIRPVL